MIDSAVFLRNSKNMLTLNLKECMLALRTINYLNTFNYDDSAPGISMATSF